ncbi:PREDICTED: heterogeneous nuclear ribonucleoprotein R-like isoform X2 [Rhagoletis zephyria]|uniref:heterogeneous nuclear ribonucleoprotein R-like isoform X2 n=1 Tax=Rhagoletis zephyria TaxID=28612 RepID=UPI0008112938|nr:PREDICTED: heterogeneous nuclear ribonucleoprotein R-like isoform X2 [Rhagoletis zephyria]
MFFIVGAPHTLAGLIEVIIYSSPDDKKKNRGFCFLEYESHKAASLAKRRLGTGRIKVWGCDIIVDWADPQEEPDEQTMSKVKVLYVRNLTQDVSEEKLKEQFEQFGKVERVKKIKDYAFVHFEDRDSAVIAMRGLNGKEIGASNIEVSLAKPPSDKKKKEEILRARERRMMQMMQGRPGLVGYEQLSPYRNLSPTHPNMMSLATPMRLPGGPRIPLRAPIPRDYDYDYDLYGYSDYRGGYNESYYDDFYRTYDGEYFFDYPPSGVAPFPTGGPAGGLQRTARNNVYTHTDRDKVTRDQNLNIINYDIISNDSVKTSSKTKTSKLPLPGIKISASLICFQGYFFETTSSNYITYIHKYNASSVFWFFDFYLTRKCVLLAYI